MVDEVGLFFGNAEPVGVHTDDAVQVDGSSGGFLEKSGFLGMEIFQQIQIMDLSVVLWRNSWFFDFPSEVFNGCFLWLCDSSFEAEFEKVIEMDTHQYLFLIVEVTNVIKVMDINKSIDSLP